MAIVLSVLGFNLIGDGLREALDPKLKIMTLLSVKDLEVQFSTRKSTIYAVNGISFDLDAGETLGIVGESGCGKSVTSLAMLGILPKAGRVPNGTWSSGAGIMLKLSDSELRDIRGKDIAMIFQDPMTSLNPVLRIGRQITESIHEAPGSGQGRRAHRRRSSLAGAGRHPRCRGPAEATIRTSSRGGCGSA